MTKTEILNCLSKISHEDDTQSFKELYRFYFLRLFHFCLGIVHQKEAAEEIVHNVFLHLWEKRVTLNKIENPDIYLYVSVKNNSLDFLSKKHLKETVDISNISSDFLLLSSDPEQLLLTEEMRQVLNTAIEQLPPRCKHIFRLIKEDGLKYKEVAAILNLSVKTVEAQMSLAIKKLAKAVLLYRNEECGTRLSMNS